MLVQIVNFIYFVLRVKKLKCRMKHVLDLHNQILFSVGLFVSNVY